MKRMLMTAAALALAAACNPDGAGDRSTGAADGDYEVRAGGPMDTTAATGTPGIGTTGAMAGGSGDTRAAPGTEGPVLSDAGILSRIAVANQLEVQEARLAQEHAQSAGVKELARTLERDHSMNLEKVKALQAEVGETVPDARGEALRDAPDVHADLAGKTGAEFDEAFLARQKKLHEENIRAFETQFSSAAQDAEVRTLVQQTLPTLRQHLSMIERLQERR